SRRVSPVGAQSTTIASQSPDSAWVLSCRSENSSSAPGGTVSSSAAIRSTPRSASTPPSHSCAADQLRSSSSRACTCWAHTPPPTSVGTAPTGTCSDSASECAGSVESTRVRAPPAAQRRAVAAATDVLPTPPLPVYRMIRGPIEAPAVYGRFFFLGFRTRTVVPALVAFPARSRAVSTTVYVPALRGTCQPKLRLPYPTEPNGRVST